MDDLGSKDLPGTYRVADKSRVAFADALETWVPLAHNELITTARKYNSVVTYLELSEYVQETSGIRTRVLLTNWIGKLLEAVAVKAADDGLPPITSICVRQDGTIGPGYATAPKSIAGDPGDDIELYAAEHRLLCYREFATDLPADGGSPTLTKKVVERRARVLPKVERPVAFCLNHPNLALPASGVCDDCE